VIEMFYDRPSWRLPPAGHLESLLNVSTAFELVHLREDPCPLEAGDDRDPTRPSFYPGAVDASGMIAPAAGGARRVPACATRQSLRLITCSA
jgi:hypothetical protein